MNGRNGTYLVLYGISDSEERILDALEISQKEEIKQRTIDPDTL